MTTTGRDFRVPSNSTEEEPLRRARHDLGPVGGGQEVQTLLHERHAGRVGVLPEHLVGRVAGPHEALRTVGVDDPPDEAGQVVVGRLLLAQGVEGGDLHHHALEPRHGAQGLHLVFPDGAPAADEAQVVDEDGRAGELLAAPRQGRQAVGGDEGADGQPVPGGGGEHPLEAGAVAPALRRHVPRIDAEAVDPLRGETRHLLLDGGIVPVDDADAAEDIRSLGHGLEHVAVVGAVVAHLHQHDAVDAAGPGVAEDVLHVEGAGLGVGRVAALGEGVGLVVVGPDVDVGVDVSQSFAPTRPQ